MLLTGFAVLVGLAVGLALPARRHHRSKPRLRWLILLAGGLVLQVLAASMVGWWSTAIVLLAYGALIAFALGNLQLPGTGVLSIGLAMNALVIGVNGSMPVHSNALVAAGVVRAEELDRVSLQGHRRLETSSTRLTFLDDRIPVPATGQVVSFGDLVLAVAAADIVANFARRRRQWPGVHAAPVIDLREEKVRAARQVRPARVRARATETIHA